MTPGREWATVFEQTDLWLSRGRRNPDPQRFTEDVLTLDGVKLYDLLQFEAIAVAATTSFMLPGTRSTSLLPAHRLPGTEGPNDELFRGVGKNH